VWNNITSAVLLRHFNSIYMLGFLLCTICNLIVLLSNWIENTTGSLTSLQEENYQQLSIPSSHGKQYSGEYLMLILVLIVTCPHYFYGVYANEIDDSTMFPSLEVKRLEAALMKKEFFRPSQRPARMQTSRGRRDWFA
jgi:hypothetical protein